MIKVCLAIYRTLLLAYPAEFRVRYGEEMMLVFEDSLSGAFRSGGWWAAMCCFGRTLADVASSACRERLAEMNRGTVAILLTGMFGWALLIFVEFHSSEVQAPVLVLLSLGFLFGAAFPKRILLSGASLGIAIPVGHFVALLFGRGSAGSVSGSLVAVVPAIVGAALGATARAVASLPDRVEEREGYVLLGLACLAAGGLIGLADFTLITPIFALTGVALCGSVLGYFCRRPWAAAICLGFAVPVAVVLMMALRASPTRHHYVFVDARAIPLCMFAAGVGLAARRLGDRFGGEPVRLTEVV